MLCTGFRRSPSTPARVAAAGVVFAFLALLQTGCSRKADGKAQSGHGGGGHAAGAAGAGPGGNGGAPAEPPTHVAVEPAARGVAVLRYATTATLEAENRAEILARAGGVVASLKVEEGDLVRAGQPLLLLDDAELRVRVRQAEVELAKQQTIWERQKNSYEQEVIPKAEFDLARTNFEAAEAQLELARQQLAYTRVQAPFAGTVTRRHVNVGQTVNVSSPLFEIANFRPLLARVHVPAKEMGTLAEGQAAELVLDSNGAKLTGTVRLVSPVVDPTTGTIKVTLAVTDYPAGTRPGDFVKVNVVTARRDDVVRVPNLAVFEDKGERVVYIAQDSVAVRRPVQIGFVDDTHTEVKTGVATGDRIVVKGQRSLKDGGRIRILNGTAEAKAEPASVADRKGA
jgi:membrane fusion protein (multidrug efflux system)